MSSRTRFAVGFAVAYLLVVLISPWLSSRPSWFATFWIPSGLFLAALLLRPRADWPLLIAIGTAVHLVFELLMFGRPVWVGAGISAAYVIEAWLGASLIRWFVPDPPPGEPRLDLSRFRVLLVFGGVVCLVSTVAGAAIGFSVVRLAYEPQFSTDAFTWWAADAAGVLVSAPLLLVPTGEWRAFRQGVWHEHRLEAAASGVVLAVVSVLVFWRGVVPALSLPVLLWITFRFGGAGLALALPPWSIVGVLGTNAGYGVFAQLPMFGSTATLQAFLIAITLCFLSLASACAEAGRNARAVAALNRSLATEVDERTNSLKDVIAQLRLAMKVADLGTWQWTVGTTTFSMNDRLRDLLEMQEVPRTREEVFSRFHPDDVARIKAEFDVWLEHGGPWVYEHRMVTRDGGLRWLAGRATLTPRSDGSVVATGVIYDVTAQKTAAEEQRKAEAALRERDERFRQLADNLEAGLWILEVEGRRMRYASSGFRRMWNFDPTTHDEGAERWAALISPEDRDRVAESFEAFLAGARDYNVEYRITLPDGRRRWIHDRAFAVECDPAGTVRVVAGLSIDTTERREAEQALRDVDRRRSEFLAMLAHELRNPLAAARAAVQVLGSPGADEPVRAEASAVIERQVTHIIRIVDDLLDESSLSRGRLVLQPERIDLARVIRETLLDYRAMFETAGVGLDGAVAEDAVWVDGDGSRLAQVLGNLLHNASKFTPRGGRVQVRLGDDPETREAVLLVGDTGPGIDPTLLPHVFDPFIQAEQTLGRSAGGIGLGLSLVKGIVLLHGGQVGARNGQHGAGATFEVRLPRVDRPAADPEPATPSPGKPLRVVVIEDGADAAMMLKTLLTFQGHVVSVARTGLEGVRLTLDMRPHLVLCDLGLPGELDGLGVARELRAAGSQAYLVALTGYAGDEHQRAAARAGFDRHVAKPLDHEDLLALCASVTAGPVA